MKSKEKPQVEKQLEKAEDFLDMLLDKAAYKNAAVDKPDNDTFVVTGVFAPKLRVRFRKRVDHFDCVVTIHFAWGDDDFTVFYTRVEVTTEVKEFWNYLGELDFNCRNQRRDEGTEMLIAALRTGGSRGN